MLAADANGDRAVDFKDLVVLAQGYNVGLPAAASELAAQAATADEAAVRPVQSAPATRGVAFGKRRIADAARPKSSRTRC